MAERRQDYHGVRIISKHHSECFTENLKECFNKESTADVVLLVNSCPEAEVAGKWIPIQGNQCVLGAMSSVFREILLSVPNSGETVLTVHMAGYSYAAVYGLVHFLYYGYCPLWVDIREMLQILSDFKLVESGAVDDHVLQQEKERERRLLLEQFFSEDEDGSQTECLEIGPFVETKLEIPADDDCNLGGVMGNIVNKRHPSHPVPETKERRKRGRPRKSGNAQPPVHQLPSLRQHMLRSSDSGAISMLPNPLECSQLAIPKKRGRPRKDGSKQRITTAPVSHAPSKDAPVATSSSTSVVSQSPAMNPVLMGRPMDMAAVVSSVGGRFIPIKMKANLEDVPLHYAADPQALPACPAENTALKIAIPAPTEAPPNPEGGAAVLPGIPNAPACSFLIIVNNTQQQPQDSVGGQTENEPTPLGPQANPTTTGGTLKPAIPIAPRETPPESVTRYRCGTCDETFASEWDCRRHLKKHRYKCRHCDKTYPVLCRLQSHMRRHTKEKPFTCHVCQKSFGHRRTLEYHLTIHSTVRSHQCSLCGKTFKRKGYLRLHMRVHTMEKPYVCQYCGKRFTQCCNMRAHVKTHQTDLHPIATS